MTTIFVQNTDLTLLRYVLSVKLHMSVPSSTTQVTEHQVGSKVLLEKGYLTVIIELLPGRLYISSLFLILSNRFGTEL